MSGVLRAKSVALKWARAPAPRLHWRNLQSPLRYPVSIFRQPSTPTKTLWLLSSHHLSSSRSAISLTRDLVLVILPILYRGPHTWLSWPMRRCFPGRPLCAGDPQQMSLVPGRQPVSWGLERTTLVVGLRYPYSRSLSVTRLTSSHVATTENHRVLHTDR